MESGDSRRQEKLRDRPMRAGIAYKEEVTYMQFLQQQFYENLRSGTITSTGT